MEVAAVVVEVVDGGSHDGEVGTETVVMAYSGGDDDVVSSGWGSTIGVLGDLRSPRRELRNELKYVQNRVNMNEISCLKNRLIVVLVIGNHNGNVVAVRAKNNGMGTMKIRLVRESTFAKPHHMIAPGLSGYSPEESYGSNDMVYNYYLEEARKKTQERNRNFKPREMHSARTHNTLHDYKPKPRSNHQTSKNWPASKSSDVTLKDVQKAKHSRNSRSYSDSKHFVCSRCQKCVFNANHDARVTTFLKDVNSYANVQSHKTRNSNKLVEQKIHTKKPIR
nr:hypothetical protein [Tanacetum cinerariifolium]